MAQFEILEKAVCYAGFFRMEKYRLRHQLFHGGWSRPLVRELFERGHAAAVLPYDPYQDRIVLVEQFRIGALEAPEGPWLLEIVAGMIAAGETPVEVVRREAMEEAHCALQELEFICDYMVSPGGTSERLSLYCGKVDTTGLGGIYGSPEEDEDIRVTVVSYEEALGLLRHGKIISAAPIIALQWLQLHHETLRQRWQD